MVVILCISVLAIAHSLLSCRLGIDGRAPSSVAGQIPLIGAAGFWTERWSFFQQSVKASKTGNFSFKAGSYDVIGLSGSESRHTFYHSKNLGIAEGYAILGGNLPSAHVDGEEGDDIWPKQEFLTYMRERVKRMLHPDTLRKRLFAVLRV